MMGSGVTIPVNLEAVFNQNSGTKVSQEYKQMVKAILSLAKDAGYKTEQLFNSKGIIKSYKEAGKYITQIGANITAQLDSQTKKIQNYAVRLTKLGGGSISKGGRFVDGELQESKTRVTAKTTNYYQDYSRLFKQLTAAETDYHNTSKKLNDQEDARLEAKKQRIEEIKKLIYDLNREAAGKGWGEYQEDKLELGGDSLEARQQRSLVHSYEQKITNIGIDDEINKLHQLEQAEEAATQATQNYYNAKAQLYKMRASGNYTTEELAEQKDYVATLKQTQQQEIDNFKSKGGLVEESEKLSNAYHDGKLKVATYSKQMEQANNIMGKLGERFTQIFKGVVMAGASWKIWAMLVAKIKESLDVIKELDSAMVDLQMATGETQDVVKGLISDYNKMAKELGTTTTEVAKSADTWLKILGHLYSNVYEINSLNCWKPLRAL